MGMMQLITLALQLSEWLESSQVNALIVTHVGVEEFRIQTTFMKVVFVCDGVCEFIRNIIVSPYTFMHEKEVLRAQAFETRAWRFSFPESIANRPRKPW